MARLTTSQLFDTGRYPMDRPGGAEFDALVTQARAGLAETNCARLESFVRPDILKQMQEEAERLAAEAVFHPAGLNPYFSQPPEGTPEDHPLNRFSPRRHGMIRADRFEREGAIWSIFQNADLCHFVATALGYDTLYAYDDPFGSVNVNVQPEGCEFAWHFDNNDFTVSFGLRQSAAGGDFEFVPNLRSDTDENYEGVKHAQDGDLSNVRSLRLVPGDLQLFRGGCTLHRVTAPKGGDRRSLLVSYATEPGAMTSADTAIRIWGEAHSDHYAHDAQRVETG
ncbi:MAG: hypothetical protein J4G15_05615 [Alphaproteobacteria bacterium]|nr:hypothetical protein [Alphaproteobacteria bacterium]